MINKRNTSSVILFISLIFGLLATALAGASSSDKPNVLFITIDALRSDHLSCYGYKRDTSFNIDRLAKEGVLFRKAIAQGGVTRTSVPSILTSMYPKNHGVYWFGDTINPKIATLAEVLKKAGYRTMGGSVKGGHTDISGINRGFDSFVDFSKDEEIAPWISQWINGSNKTPFFIWVHYMPLHSVCHPPAPYDTLYVSDKLKPFFAKREPRFYSMPVLIDGELAEDYKSYYVSQYDGAIRFVDDQIGLILKELERLGLKENTLVIISSDHGELLEEHNSFATHLGVFEECLRVPLVMSYQKKIPAGKAIDKQVRSIDIMPTILEIAGVKLPSAIDGQSLLPLAQGKQKETSPYVFSEFYDDITGEHAVSLRTPNYKLVLRVTYELYAINDAPPYASGLKLIKNKEVFDTLRKKLEDYLKQDNSPYNSRENKDKERPKLKPEAEERLRSLGYLH